jgi:hypothetical protein
MVVSKGLIFTISAFVAIPSFLTRVEKMLIGIPLVFNFTPLSNFSLSLFQAKVFHRRIANETNDNKLNE